LSVGEDDFYFLLSLFNFHKTLVSGQKITTLPFWIKLPVSAKKDKRNNIPMRQTQHTQETPAAPHQQRDGVPRWQAWWRAVMGTTKLCLALSSSSDSGAGRRDNRWWVRGGVLALVLCAVCEQGATSQVGKLTGRFYGLLTDPDSTDVGAFLLFLAQCTIVLLLVAFLRAISQVLLSLSLSLSLSALFLWFLCPLA